jgi:ribosomal protein S12 methylthiotransferase
MERCESGRIGLTANELTGETRSEGSNPSLSATRRPRRTPSEGGPSRRRATRECNVGEQRYWLQTLGCPKNRVDSDKLVGALLAEGFAAAARPEEADLVVVNTCAFIEEARRESIETILELDEERRPGSRLVVTGCMAERYGAELAEAIPEVDLVAGFGMSLSPPLATPVTLRASAERVTSFDLLELPRPPARSSWAYLKAAEGCDRACGFCAIPSFRGPQRSRALRDLVAEAEVLVAGDGSTPGVREIVIVAQDLASYGRDRSTRRRRRLEGRDDFGGGIVELVEAVAAVAARTILLYLYPSSLTERLIDAVLATGVPYFDLSLQHVSRPLLARMRRWGDRARFLERIERIRGLEERATFRSSFILGYPGETEADHDQLLGFLAEAELDWAGFFLFSAEEGTLAYDLADQVDPELALERLRECTELQDRITAGRRDRLVGQERSVLVDAAGVGRSVHEAPEIDGVVRIPSDLPVGAFRDMEIVDSLGVDLVAEPVLRRPSGSNGRPFEAVPT